MRYPGTRTPGQRIGQVFLSWLAFRLNLFGIPGRKITRAFLGRLAFGLNLFGALGLGCAVPGPIVPTIYRLIKIHIHKVI